LVACLLVARRFVFAKVKVVEQSSY
jgi:hypothetical protein